MEFAQQDGDDWVVPCVIPTPLRCIPVKNCKVPRSPPMYESVRRQLGGSGKKNA